MNQKKSSIFSQLGIKAKIGESKEPDFDASNSPVRLHFRSQIYPLKNVALAT
jgi:hypothetical protein